MDIERDFFRRKRPDFTKLSGAGFARKGDLAVYREAFLEEQFLAELTVTADGQVRGRVIDQDTGEEYLPIRARDHIGGFVGAVREGYLEVLGRIADACFVPMDFAEDQSNRIAAAMQGRYGVAPAFPWEKFPGNGTFSRPDNGKWFAALLTVSYGKLEHGVGPEQVAAAGEGKLAAKAFAAETPPVNEAGAAKTDTEIKEVRRHTPDAETIVEVLNLKADPNRIPALTCRPGIYRAWHMNKKHWISVLLDETLPDEEVLQLIEASWQLTAGGKSAGHVTGDAWIIPSNPKIYDVDEGFATSVSGEIEWHQHNNIKSGDELYIYSAAPNSAILYRCEVTASDLHYQGMFQDKDGYERSMRIRLVERYPKNLFPLAFLKAHGGGPVRGARRMPAQLLAAMRQRLAEEGGKRYEQDR